MAADLAQKIDIVERIEPIRIIGHHGIAGSVAEREESCEDRADAAKILFDHLFRQQLAALFLAGRVADPRGATPHERDWAMPGFLHPREHHDLHETADVKRRRGGVEANIAGYPRRRGKPIERLRLGDL